jgi:hypothetical protein
MASVSSPLDADSLPSSNFVSFCCELRSDDDDGLTLSLRGGEMEVCLLYSSDSLPTLRYFLTGLQEKKTARVLLSSHLTIVYIGGGDVTFSYSRDGRSFEITVPSRVVKGKLEGVMAAHPLLH